MKRNQEESAFTRLDLIAVTGVLLLLGMLSLPSFGESVSGSQAVICQNNQRQLVKAWHLYAADYSEYFAPVYDNTSANTPPTTWVGGNASGYGGSGETFNPGVLTNSTSALAPYLNRNPRVFKCPADASTFLVGGVRLQTIRSVAINVAVGTKSSLLGGDGKSPTNGEWLDGSHGHIANAVFRCYAKLSDVVNPRPSNLFLFLDEGPLSINDGVLACVGPGYESRGWIDWPAAYHRGGGGISYMDGHAEIHSWISTDLLKIAANSSGPGPSLPDQSWLSQRTTARVVNAP